VETHQIVILMASSALHGIFAMTIGPTLHVHDVGMAIVALAGIIAFRVAIHAAGVTQNRYNRFEGSRYDGVLVTRCRWLSCRMSQKG
jgi:hypothetical protein